MPNHRVGRNDQIGYDQDYNTLLRRLQELEQRVQQQATALLLKTGATGKTAAPAAVPKGSATPAPTTGYPSFSGIVKSTGNGFTPAIAGSDYLAPGGTAGGDLSGTLPNPGVAKLQGRTVASAAPSSGQVLTWDGAQWEPADPTGGGGGGGSSEPGQTPPTPPPTVAGGTWTEINFEGVATATDSLDGIMLIAPPVSGDDSRLLVRSVPGSTFTVTARVRDLLFTNAFATAGVCLRESGTGRIIRVVYQWGGLLVLDRLTAPNVAPTSGVTLENYGGSTGEDPEWFRLVNDGSDLRVYVSPDGELWDQLHSESVGSWLTPDQYGIIANSNNTARRAAVRLISLQESTP